VFASIGLDRELADVLLVIGFKHSWFLMFVSNSRLIFAVFRFPKMPSQGYFSVDIPIFFPTKSLRIHNTRPEAESWFSALRR
jgi:hypothetical protein